MGCDIHTRAEIRQADGSWQAITTKVFPNPYWDAGQPESWNEWNSELCVQPYRGRNYEFFALLAGVRNYENRDPIDEPRGVPEDASPEWLSEVEDWGLDMHSTSHFTLAELQPVLAELQANVNDAEEWGTKGLALLVDNLTTEIDPERIRVVFGFDN